MNFTSKYELIFYLVYNYINKYNGNKKNKATSVVDKSTLLYP